MNSPQSEAQFLIMGRSLGRWGLSRAAILATVVLVIATASSPLYGQESTLKPKPLAHRLAAIQEKAASVDQGPRVFHDTGDLWTPGPDTLVGEVYALLKAENIAHDITGYAQLSPQVLLDRDPEVIITA